MTTIDPMWMGGTDDDDIYKDNIIDHYKHPHNKKNLEDADAHARVFNPVCGDDLTFFVKHEHNTLTHVTFIGHGCAISQAAASMLTDHVKGKTLQEATQLTSEDIVSLLGITLSIVRMKCATLPLESLHKTLVLLEEHHEQT